MLDFNNIFFRIRPISTDDMNDYIKIYSGQEVHRLVLKAVSKVHGVVYKALEKQNMNLLELSK